MELNKVYPKVCMLLTAVRAFALIISAGKPLLDLAWHIPSKTDTENSAPAFCVAVAIMTKWLKI